MNKLKVAVLLTVAGVVSLCGTSLAQWKPKPPPPRPIETPAPAPKPTATPIPQPTPTPIPSPTAAPTPTPTPTPIPSAGSVVFDLDANGYLIDQASRAQIYLTDRAGNCYRLQVKR